MAAFVGVLLVDVGVNVPLCNCSDVFSVPCSS